MGVLVVVAAGKVLQELTQTSECVHACKADEMSCHFEFSYITEIQTGQNCKVLRFLKVEIEINIFLNPKGIR